MDATEDLSKSIRDTGRRMTRQRRAILHTLESVTCHPTAAELYEMVRREIAGISPGTVYRNLNVLQELSFVREIRTAGEPTRYDARVQDHPHARCSNCGCVVDVPLEPDVCIDEAADELVGWQLTGYSVQFDGICPNCISKSQAEKGDSEGPWI
jgi:Fur family ferric uptake transcriptional regulator